MMMCSLKYCAITSPIGNLTLEYCQHGLHSISQVQVYEENFKPSTSVKVGLVVPQKSLQDEHVIKESIQWFQDYFDDPLLTAGKQIPALCKTTMDDSFRYKVRNALVENVKAGQTISYGALAELVSNKGASRAVGSAMSNNPFSVIVPCHRVIKSDGTLGNYGKGRRNDIKRWLLEFEGNKI